MLGFRPGEAYEAEFSAASTRALASILGTLAEGYELLIPYNFNGTVSRLYLIYYRINTLI